MELSQRWKRLCYEGQKENQNTIKCYKKVTPTGLEPTTA